MLPPLTIFQWRIELDFSASNGTRRFAPLSRYDHAIFSINPTGGDCAPALAPVLLTVS